MFRASLRPSSGDQTAFSLPIVFCPVVTVVMLESRLASCVHYVGRQPYAPATFTPGEIPGTHFVRLSRPQGTWFCL